MVHLIIIGDSMENHIKSFDSVENLIIKLKDNNIEVLGKRNMTVTSIIIEIPIRNAIATILVFTTESNIHTIRPIIIVKENCEVFNTKYIPGYIIHNLDQFFNDVMTYMNLINKEEA